MLSAPSNMQETVAAALKCRRGAGFSSWQPICVYDLVISLGIELRFLDLTSLEGMYCQSYPPAIIVSSLRPSGRQRFTCAHELGHHVLGHGQKLDELIASDADSRLRDPHERHADAFAAHLLMPRSTVERAFRIREVHWSDCSAASFLSIAGAIGVGYTTLIQHLRVGLSLIGAKRAAELSRNKPIDLRREMLSSAKAGDVFVVDECWERRSVDLQVGDCVLVPTGTHFVGNGLERASETPLAFEAMTAGVSRLRGATPAWELPVRIAQNNYVGRGIYRYRAAAKE